MVNATGRRARKDAQSATTNNDTPSQNGHTTVSTPAPTFDLNSIGVLGEDFSFDRGNRGRARVPSQFDEVVKEWVGNGFRYLPVADKDAGAELIKDLQKATDYHGYGLSKRVQNLPQVGEGLYVVFEIKAEKEKRTRKPKGESNGEAPAPVTDEATAEALTTE